MCLVSSPVFTEALTRPHIPLRTAVRVIRFFFKWDLLCLYVCLLFTGLPVITESSSPQHPLLLLLLSRFSRVRLCATPWTEPTRLLHPWDSPGKSTGVGCHSLLQIPTNPAQTAMGMGPRESGKLWELGSSGELASP